MGIPKLRVLNEVHFPISNSKYTADIDMSRFSRAAVTIMARIKPVNETGVIFSSHGDTNHIGLRLDGSRLFLMFKDRVVDLGVDLMLFKWNAFSVQLSTTKGDCSVAGHCCISASTFLDNEFQSTQELCLAVTDEMSREPTHVTIGKVCIISIHYSIYRVYYIYIYGVE